MTIPRIVCALVCAAWLSACGNDKAGNDQPQPQPTTVELTAFARDLVENQTRDDSKPAEIEGTTFTDAEDANAFATAFFG